MDIAAFDRMNEIDGQKRLSMDYDTYFGEMNLSEEEKDKRKVFSEELEKNILFFFFLYQIAKAMDYEDEEFIKRQLKEKYQELVKRQIEIDEKLKNHILDFTNEIYETTKNHENDEWYFSSDRAVLTSENESNCIFNYDEYRSAVLSGRKNKTWITMNDKRVRHTHRILDYKTIPINGVFLVGDSEMLFPKDESLGANMKEIANCRCTIKYF